MRISPVGAIMVEGTTKRQAKLLKRLEVALAGKASRTVKVSARLTGPAADAWTTLREAAEGLNLSDSDLFAVLVEHGFGAVAKALKQVPRS